MKKLLAIILALALLPAFAAAEEAPAEAYGKPAPGNQLGYILLKELYTKGENCVISPYSLALALGMAAEGAKGETLAQLKELLCADDLEELSGAVPQGIRSANSVFVKDGISLMDAYVERLNEGYAAEWFAIDKKVVGKVNSWVKKKTDGLIDGILNDVPAENIAMLLLNAIAMDARWEAPFASEATREEVFHAGAGDVTVDMMHQTAWFDYAEKDGVQVIRLPYEDSDLEMWLALPAADGEEGLDMEGLLDVLAGEGAFYLSSDAETTEVRLSLPKFDIACGSSLAEAISGMGAELPFSAAADFSGISDTPLAIDSIIQKVRVQVDEDGTKAAAATMLAMVETGAPGMKPEPVEMRLDRPFAFVISDAQTGSLCFAGVVENPAA